MLASRFAMLCAGPLFVASAHASPPARLPLKPGTYVVSTYKPCQEAPLAGVKTFDGQSFFGPHESACTTSIDSRQGHTYRVSTVCLAHGDGTPETPTVWGETVRVLSPGRFSVGDGEKTVNYALCQALR